jgi:hypothetical protein
MNDNIKNALIELERALFSRYRQSWETQKPRGSLDPRRCYRAVCGSSDVFRVKDVREERTSAVGIVADLSSSMQGYKARALGQMTNGFQEVFRNSQVNWELTGFHTHGVAVNEVRVVNTRENSGDVTSDTARDEARYSGGTSLGGEHTLNGEEQRRESNRMSIGVACRFKSFGTLTPQTKLGNIIATCCSGGTRDAQVYRLAVERLARQEQSTKLAIYLGDGAGNGMEFIREVNDWAIDHGIVTMGIGLGAGGGAVKAWAFDTCIHVRDPDELSQASFVESTRIINQLRKERCK